ncbi:MAG: tRNA pseudouridine(13) synthase TruD [Desulfuromonadaceae bacterium]|nr:tRNA pseudouridine(13) synthase TruD [Desulfuromonadaceae bacterium]
MTGKLVTVTGHIAGTGGTFKVQPEDFLVEEVPFYLPCGEGEHLYLQVEKRNLTTLDLVHSLARSCDIREREIGYAGLKDARGVTRQWLSLPARSAEGKLDGEQDRFRILARCRHRNKLRLGHLRGNRFRIRIRGVETGAMERAEKILLRLREQGVPNTFGEQRFGALGNSHRIGRAILQENFEEAIREILGVSQQIRDPRWQEGATRFAAGDLEGALAVLPGNCRHERKILQLLLQGRSCRQALLALPQRLLRLYLSAFQSLLFDRLVGQRLPDLGLLWAGDLAMKHANGAVFSVIDPAREQPRADAFEISPSAPLFGCKVLLAADAAGKLEERLLKEENLCLESFALPGPLRMEGARRALRVPLEEAAVVMDGEDLWLSFMLPSGSYATCVLKEVMKNDRGMEGADQEEPSTKIMNIDSIC